MTSLSTLTLRRLGRATRCNACGELYDHATQTGHADDCYWPEHSARIAPSDVPAPILAHDPTYRVRETHALHPALAYAVSGPDGVPLDYFRRRSVADHAARMLNGGADYDHHAVIGSRIGTHHAYR